MHFYNRFISTPMQFPKRFQLLARVGKSIKIEQSGLARLQSLDEVCIVTIHGDAHPITGDILSTTSAKNIKKHGNSLWISSSPIYNSRLKKDIIFLKTNIVDDEFHAMEKTHFLCSLISSNMLVFEYNQSKLNFLVHITEAERQQAEKRREKLGLLVGVKFTNFAGSILLNTNEFQSELESQNVLNDVSLIYPARFGYDFSANLEFGELIKLIEDLNSQQFGNYSLMYGPIMASYLENLVYQFNINGSIDIADAEANIEIEDTYEEYLKAIDNYNHKALHKLGEEPQNNLKETLQQIREEVEGEFKCSDSKYTTKLSQCIDRKEEEIHSTNEEMHEKKNIQLLEKESEKSLKKIREKSSSTHADIEKELNKLSALYEREAGGESKEKLYSEYMKVFAPILYKEAGVNDSMEKRIEKMKGENKRMAEEIRRLEQNRKECCSLM